ncbi:MAG: ParB/RepB/Spo0J family partition protein [Chlamydiia bacterium]|nr:ParB/RepB/Spo0J family partition protein [Chlamydiia bacterium]
MEQRLVETTTPEKRILEVEIGKIQVNPNQPRRHFGKEELEELAESIKSIGIIQPPVVRWSAERESYELISGERRFRAAYLAGLRKIPVIVQEADAFFSAEAALVENIQRVDLNPMEIARALSEIRKFGVTQEELATRLGKKRSTICNYMRLLELARPVQRKVEQGILTMGHAKALLSVEGEENQILLAELIVRDTLSVRQAEEKAAQMGKGYSKPSEPKAAPQRQAELEMLEEKLQQHFGTKVSLQGSASKGKLVIDYYSLDDLERIMEILGVQAE